MFSEFRYLRVKPGSFVINSQMALEMAEAVALEVAVILEAVDHHDVAVVLRPVLALHVLACGSKVAEVTVQKLPSFLVEFGTIRSPVEQTVLVLVEGVAVPVDLLLVGLAVAAGVVVDAAMAVLRDAMMVKNHDTFAGKFADNAGIFGIFFLTFHGMFGPFVFGFLAFGNVAEAEEASRSIFFLPSHIKNHFSVLGMFFSLVLSDHFLGRISVQAVEPALEDFLPWSLLKHVVVVSNLESFLDLWSGFSFFSLSLQPDLLLVIGLDMGSHDPDPVLGGEVAVLALHLLLDGHALGQGEVGGGDVVEGPLVLGVEMVDEVGVRVELQGAVHASGDVGLLVPLGQVVVHGVLVVSPEETL